MAAGWRRSAATATCEMTRRDAVRAALLAPVCAGMAGAALHVAWYLCQRFLFASLVFSGSDVLWLAPASYTILAFLAGLPFLLLLILTRRPWAWRALVFVVCWASLFAAALLVRQFSSLASLLLSAGVAARLAGWAGETPERLLPRMQRFAAVMVVLSLAGLGIARGGSPALARWRDARAPEPPQGVPNVLLLIIDTERAQNTSLYGYPHRTTPVLDSLAASSTVFDWAMSAAPWTLPSHAAIFSGRPASLTDVRWFHPFNQDVPRLATVLHEHGYATGGFAANFSYAGPASGLARGFSLYLRRPVTLGRIIRAVPVWNTPTGVKIWKAASIEDAFAALRAPNLNRNFFPEGDYRTAAQISQRFLDWQARQRRPFFAFLNYLDVHEYHRPGQTPAQVHRSPSNQGGYDDAIRYDDSIIGVTLDSLKARGVLDRTIVIITADHGEQFHEHNLTGHSNSLYTQLLHVPLVVRYPAAVPQGRRIGTAVSTRDLAATIADLAGVGDRRLPGVSLAQTWREPAVARAPALSELEYDWTNDSSRAAQGPIRSLVDDTFHLIHGARGDELYRYREDTDESRNVVDDPRYAAAVARLRSELRRLPFGY